MLLFIRDKSFIKTFSVFLSIIIIFFFAFSAEASVFTRSSDFSNVVKYGMSYSEALMDSQSGSAAAKKVMGDDLLWDLIGKNYEIIGGDADALSKVKDDINNIKRVLDGVAEISRRLGAGENVEALIATMDVTVGIVNHPVVSNLWAAVKLTHQSQQMVRDTRSALQVETLYGLLNRDRRLIGVMDGNNPPLIPEDSDTVTYFFNRYLITDASTRELVKAYVETVLGESWPTLPRGSRFWATLTFTSEAAREEHELRELQDFRQVSRGWIRRLIKDLNMQVERQWAETRFRQARSEFDVFYREVGSVFESVDSAWEFFRHRAQILSEIQEYPNILKGLDNERERLWREFEEAEEDDLNYKLEIRTQIYSIADTANRYRIRSRTAEDYKLANEFDTLRQAAMNQTELIWRDVNGRFEKVAAMLVSEPQDTQYEEVHNRETGFYESRRVPRPTPEGYAAEFEKNLLRLWSPLLDHLRGAVAGIPSAPLERITYLLSNNQPDEAEDELNQWWEYVYDKVELANFSGSGVNLGGAVQRGSDMGRIMETIRERRPYMIETPQIKEELDRLEYQLEEARGENLRRRLTDEIESIKKEHGSVQIPFNGRYWRNAANQTYDALSLIYHSRDYHGEMNTGRAMISYYRKKRAQIAEEISEYYNELEPIRNTLRDALGAKVSYDMIENFLRIHTYGPYLRSEHTPARISDIRISPGWPHSTSATPPEPFSFDGWPDALDRAAQRYRNLDISEEKIRLYESFGFQRPMRIRERIDEIEKLMREVDGRQLYGRYKTLRTRIDTWHSNRNNALAHIRGLQMQWNDWYEEQKGLGNIRSDGIPSPTGETEYFTFEFDFDTRFQTDDRGGRRVMSSEYAVMTDPEHDRIRYYATRNDLGNSSRAAEARSTLNNLQVAGFLRSSMPGTWRMLNSQLNLEHFRPAPEANFIYDYGVVWASSLKKARNILDNINTKDDSFEEAVKEFGRTLPGSIDPDGTVARISHIRFLIGNIDMGKRMVEMMEELNEKIFIRNRYLFDKRVEEDRLRYQESAQEKKAALISEYREELQGFRARYNSLNSSSRITREEIRALYEDIHGLSGRFSRELQRIGISAGAGSSGFYNDITALARDTNSLNDRFRVSERQVQEFYRSFMDTYRSGNLRGVMNLLSNDWSGSEGSDRRDVEEYLSNSFRVFDSIQYRISGMSAQPSGENMIVRYELQIIGENRRQRLRHEENMSMVEELGIVDGEVRIIRTISGRQWLK